jgi:hypothetical protein
MTVCLQIGEINLFKVIFDLLSFSLMYSAQIIQSRVQEVCVKLRSLDHFSDVLLEALKDILQMAEEWGINVNASAVEADFEEAKLSDMARLRRSRSDQGTNIKDQNVTSTVIHELHVAEMRSTEIQRRGQIQVTRSFVRLFNNALW